MRRTLAAVALIASTAAADAQPTRELVLVPPDAPAAVAELRDCPDCPVMVETPAGLTIGKFPVTRGEFRVFAEATGFKGQGCYLRGPNKRQLVAEADWLAPGYEQADDHPVVCVSWLDAGAYAEWLSETTGRTYRLPTFEESAAAAAAGAVTEYWWGAAFDTVCQHANAADAQFRVAYPVDERDILSCDDGYAHTSPVTAFPPNAWGLHDMAGNVWNWTNSCLKGDCANGVFRGAGWDVPAPNLFKLAHSFGDRIMLRNDVIGFRLLREGAPE